MRDEHTQLMDQYFSMGEPIESRPDYWGSGLKHCIIIGLNSDIARGIKVRMEAEGWTVNGTSRVFQTPNDRWDLCIVCQGTMEPIGKFFDCDLYDWRHAVESNALHPLSVLRYIWPNRKQGSKVVFMSGPNPTVPNPTYTAYRAGKAVLQSLVETLNVEYPDAKFIWLIPGIVNTKIHQQTIKAGEMAANLDKAKAIVAGAHPSRSHEDVYVRLKEAIA